MPPSSSKALRNARKLQYYRRAFLEQLEAREMMIATPAKFDFGTSTSPVSSGYSQVTHLTTYTSGQGYGWTSAQASSQDQGAVIDDVRRDYVNTNNNARFQVDVANGQYDVTVSTVGNYSSRSIVVEGTTVGTVPAIASNQFYTETFRVTVTDGQLTTDFPLGVSISELSIFSPNDPALPAPLTSFSGDFGTTSSPVASNYFKVTKNDVYAPRFRYGWSTVNLPSDGDVNTVTDLVRRDYVQGPAGSTSSSQFVADVDNGTYNVTITIPGSVSSEKIYLEGTLVDTVTVASGQFYTHTYSVSVSDSQLTLGLTGDVAKIAELKFGITTPQATPEVEVALGSQAIYDGLSTIDYGAVYGWSTGISKTFTVTNAAVAGNSLSLSNLSVPSGFTITQGFGSTTLAPGASTTFVVTTNTALPGGARSGAITFNTNDSTESSFDIALTGSVSNVMIIDDGDAGFYSTGFGAGTSSQSYNGDHMGGAPGSGTLARWTFSGLSSGAYYLAAHWPLGASATSAPYTIKDGTTVLSTDAENHTIAPNQITDAGFGWNYLGNGPFDPTSGTLIVELSGVGANGWIAADAVRLEKIPSAHPSVDVKQGTRTLYSGLSTVDFGQNYGWSGGSAKTFTISNAASATSSLTLSNLSVPAGFTITQGFGQTSLPPGASTTFTVALNLAVAGSRSGAISFDMSDPNTSSFSIPLTGSVSNVMIIDDGDAGFYSTGFGGGAGSQSYNGDHMGGAPGSGTLARWTFSGLAAGTYYLAGHWPLGGSATIAPYTIKDGTTVLSTDVENHTIAPSQITDAGFGWNYLGNGPYYPSSGSLIVELSGAGANGWIAADAVRLERVATAQPEIDVREPGQSSLPSGSGILSFGTTHLDQPVTKTLQILNTGTAPLTLSAASISLPAGFTLTTSVPAQIIPGSSASIGIRFDPVAAGPISGVLSIGNNDANENPYVINVGGNVINYPSEIAISAVTVGAIADGGSLDFGQTSVGTPLTLALQIQNSGAGPLIIDVPNVQLPSGYSFISSLPASIAAGATATVNLRFNAASAGTSSGTLVLPNNDSDEGNFAIHLSAIAISYFAEIAVTNAGQNMVSGTTSIDFGTTIQGQPRSQTFVIANSGNIPLTLDVANISLPAGYAVIQAPQASVAPQDSTTMIVQLTAVASGAPAGTISIPNNDDNEDPFVILVTGDVQPLESNLVVKVGSQTISSGYSLEFGTLYTTSFATQTLTIVNTGNIPLHLANLQLPVEVTVETPWSTTVAVGAETSLTLRMTSETAHTIAGTISFSSDDPDSENFAISVHGTSLTGMPEAFVSSVALDDDTGFHNNDLITSNPSVRFTLGGTFDGNAYLEFDHNGDGIVDGQRALQAPGNAVTYDLRTTDSSFQDFVGGVNLRYRVVFAGQGGATASPWDTYAFTMESPVISLAYDFGTATSPVKSGAVRVTQSTAYSSSSGYGWQSIVNGTSSDAGTSYPDDQRDYVQFSSATFAVDVPRGVYDVTVGMGLSPSGISSRSLVMNKLQVDTISVSPGAYSERTYRVILNDGQLKLDLNGVNFDNINSLEIHSLDSSLNLPIRSAISPAGEPILFFDATTTPGSDAFSVRRSGSALEVFDTNTGLTLSSASAANVVGVVIFGQNRSNTFTLDYSSGYFPQKVEFDGGQAEDNLALDLSTVSTGNVPLIIDTLGVDVPGGFGAIGLSRFLSFSGMDGLNLRDGGKPTTTRLGDLYVRGNDSDNNILFQRGATATDVTLVFDQSQYYGPFRPTDRVVAYGRGGNDAIQQNYTLGFTPAEFHGEAGSDSLLGAFGNDLLIGGAGNDQLLANFGDDVLWGDEQGARSQSGSSDGSDNLQGGEGNDFIFGGGGGDLILGQSGNDYLHGGSGADNITGSDGNDVIRGGEGTDSLSGDAGNDILIGEGNSGTDYEWVIGGEGRDVISGGTGAEFFYGAEGEVFEDLNIADVTVWDYDNGTGSGLSPNDLVFQTISSLWTGTGTFQERWGILTNPVNNPALVVGTTVFPDCAQDYFYIDQNDLGFAETSDLRFYHGTYVTTNTVGTACFSGFPPSIQAISNHTIPESQPFTLQISASDPDSTALEYSLAPGAPSGASINGQSGVFSWTPTEAQGPGTYSITVRVSDGSQTASQTFSISVGEVNQAPVLTVPGPQSGNSGDSITFSVSATDVDLPANGLSYSISGGAQPGMTIDPSTGAFSWTPLDTQGGLWSVTIRATDNGTPSLFDEKQVAIAFTPMVTIKEDNRFLTQHAWDVTVPEFAATAQLKFLGVLFDTDSTGRMRDALEISLLNDAGQPIVPTVRQGRDAFFSLSEGLAVQTGPTADYDPQSGIIEVYLTDLPAGTHARLVARLVNDDGDVATTAAFSPELSYRSILPVQGPASPLPEAYRSTHKSINFAGLADLTNSMAATYRETNFGKGSNEVHAGYTIENSGNYRVTSPLVVVVRNLSRADVVPTQIDGYTPEGLPYYNISRLALTDGANSPGDSIFGFDLSFFNPSHEQFTYDIQILGQLNRAPVFSSTPLTTVAVGNTYNYAARASDPDQDSLQYSLLQAPAGMTINASSGAVSYSPSTADIGVHTVVIRTNDPWGLFQDQVFTLQVTNALNLPPRFTSVPIVDAYVGQDYSYPASALDPDGDTLTFTMPSGADGMTFANNSVGLLTWAPPSRLAGSLVPVQLEVSDGRGGTAQQSFSIYVHRDPANEPPVFISQPQTDFAVPTLTTPEVFEPELGISTQAGVATISGQVWLDSNFNHVRDEFNSVADQVELAGIGPEILGPNDDLSTSALDLGFTLQFFGRSFNQIYINNNGNITFDGPEGGYDPSSFPRIDIYGAARPPMIAPFWADVDTGSYLSGTVHLAHGVSSRGNNFVQIDWDKVGYFRAQTDKLNDFTLWIEDRVDGDMVAFVYRDMEWTTGSASQGINGFGGFPATIGFDSGNGIDYEVYGRPDSPSSIAQFANRTIVFKIDADGVPVRYSESGIDGFDVQLIDRTTNNVVATQRSRSEDLNDNNSINPLLESGWYRFNNIAPGSYEVRVLDRANYLGVNPTPLIADVSVVAGQVLRDVDFGVSRKWHYPAQALDPDGDALTYELIAAPTGATISASTGEINWLPTSPGDYNFIVRAFDPRGGIARQSFVVHVDNEFVNLPPDIVSHAPLFAQTDKLYSYQLRATDPNLDEIHFELVNGPAGATINDAGLLLWSPEAADVGTQHFEVKVIDSWGATSAQLFDVAVVQSAANSPPRILSLPITTIFAGQYLAYDVEAVDDDGDGLSYRLLTRPAGMLIQEALGYLRWTPTEEQLGDHEVELQVIDSRGSIATQRFVLKVLLAQQNDPPQITSAPPGPGTVGSVFSYQVVAEDPNGDPLQFFLNSDDPTVTISEAGLLEWNPVEATSAQLVVTVWDGRGGEARQSFRLDALTTAVPPTINNGPKVPVVLGSSFVFDVDSDQQNVEYTLSPTAEALGFSIDGDVIHWTPVSLGNFQLGVTVTQIGSGQSSTKTFDIPVVAPVAPSTPPHFTSAPSGPAYIGFPWTYELSAADPDGDIFEFSMDSFPSGAVLNNGVVSWTPTAESAGESFTIRVTDQHGSSQSQSFAPAVLSSVPMSGPAYISSTPILTVTLGDTYQYQVTAVDPESGSITYSLASGPSGMQISAGLVTWTPTAVGTFNVVVSAIDAGGQGQSQQFMVEVVEPVALNDAPDIASAPNGPAFVGSLWTYELSAVDPDGDTFAFAIEASPGGAEMINGVVSWTPTATSAGESFVIRVTDEHGNSQTQSFALPVWANVPTSGPAYITSTPILEVTLGDAYQYQVVAVDPEAGPVTYLLTSGPSGMQVSSSGLVSWTPNSLGSFTVLVTAIDAETLGGYQEFTVNVVAPITLGTPPRFTSAPSGPAFVGSPWTYELSAVDTDGDTFAFSMDSYPVGAVLSNGVISWTPTASVSASFVVRITDQHGNSQSQSFLLPALVGVPTSGPAYITSTPILEVTLGDAYQYQVVAVDPEAGPVIYSLTSGPSGMEIGSSGLVTWRPSSLGSYTVRVSAVDADALGAYQQFTVNVVAPFALNAAPDFESEPPMPAVVGRRYSYSIHASDANGDAITFSLDPSTIDLGADVDSSGLVTWTPAIAGMFHFKILATDSRGAVTAQDFDLPVLANSPPAIYPIADRTIELGDSLTVNLSAFDPGDTTTFSIDAGPLGVPSIPANSSVLGPWTPTVAGVYMITVRATDSEGESSTTAFNVRVIDGAIANQAPSITSAPRDHLGFGQTLGHQFVGSDPDEDNLTYSLLPGAPDGMTLTSSGYLRWKPVAADVSSVPHTFTVQVSDGRGAASQATFGIVVVNQPTNDPPSFTTVPKTGLVVNVPFAYHAEAVDPNQDALSFALIQSPAEMTIDPVSGLVLWTPRVSDLGLHILQIRATDALGANQDQTFNLTVRGANRPPLIDNSPSPRAVVNQLYSYAIQAHDPDGDRLHYSLSTTYSQSGMAVDPNTGVFTWTPSFTGIATVGINVVDEYGLGVTQVYSLDVSETAENLPPLFGPLGMQFAQAGAMYSVLIHAEDPENANVAYSLVGTSPAGLSASINALTGILTWSNPSSNLVGQYVTFQIQASDGVSTSSLSLPVGVESENQAPVVNTVTTLATAGAIKTIDLHASDSDPNDYLIYSLDSAAVTLGISISNVGQISWMPMTGQVSATPYVFNAIVDDQHGHVVVTPISILVQADTVAPTVVISTSQSQIPVDGTIRVTVLATDNVGVASRTLTMSVTANGQTTQTPLAVSTSGTAIVRLNQAGTVTFSATATDVNGNLGTAAPITVLVTDPANVSPPIASLALPLDNARVSDAIDIIGSVSDDVLTNFNWMLRAVPSDGGETRVLAVGTSAITNNVLGRLDPTLLRNGTWKIELIAVDSGGNQTVDSVNVEVESQLKLGAFTVSFTDMELHAPGFPLQVVRTYNSLDADKSGDFGYGWSLSIKQTKVDVSFKDDDMLGFTDGTRVVITLPDGTKQGFTFYGKALQTGPVSTGQFYPNFVPDIGVKSKLLVDKIALIAGGSPGTYIFPESGEVYDPRNKGFTLQLRNGTDLVILPDGTLDSIVDPIGNRTVIRDDGLFSFDKDNNPTGRGIEFGRDFAGRITTITDPAGKQVIYNYDAYGNLKSVLDRAQATTSFSYLATPAHYLDRITDSLGRTAARSEYYPDGRLKKITDAANKTIEYSYGLNTRSQTTTDQLGNQTTQVFDSRGNVIREVNPAGNIVKRKYDDQDRLLEEITVVGQDDATSPEHNDIFTQRMSYADSANGDWEVSTDARGNKTTTYLNPQFAQPTQIVSPTGTTYIDYNPNTGLLSSTKDPSGVTTSFGYDASGNLTKLTNQDGQILVTNTYNAFGEVLTTTSATGRKTYFSYTENGDREDTWYFDTDNTGQRFKILDHTDYDDARRVVGTHRESIPVNADGVPTGPAITLSSSSTSYLPTGQVAASVDANGLQTEYKYDARGLQVEVRTQSPREDGTLQWLITRTLYDEAGRAVYSTNQFPATTAEPIFGTHTMYDSAGRVVSTSTVRGLVIEIASVGLLTYSASLSPANLTTVPNTTSTTVYDSAGRVSSTTDGYGTQSVTIYNQFGDVVESRTQSRDTSTGTPQVVWLVTRTVYEDLGRSSFVSDQFVQTDAQLGNPSPPVRGTYTIYDSIGRVQQTQRVKNVVVSLAAGTNESSRSAVPLGNVLSSSKTFYDDHGRASYSISATGGRTDYVYDVLGRRVAEIAPAVTVFWNGAEHLARLRTETVYDAQGRAATQRSNIAVLLNPDGTVNTTDYAQVREQQFTYDEQGRQVAVAQVGGSLTTTMRYEYDSLGRKTKEFDPLNQAKEMLYDQAGRLAGVKLPTVADPQNAGELTQPYYQYKYNAQGQQTGLIDPLGRQTKWTFDDRGQQLSRTLPLGVSTVASLSDPRTVAGQAGAFTEGFWYDDQGRQIRHVSFEGVVSLMVYDDSSGSGGRVVAQQFFTNLAAWNNGAGTPDEVWTYKFDAFGRQTEVTRTPASGPSRTQKHAYDAEGRMTVDDSPEGVIVYEYNALGQKTATKIFAAGANPSIDQPERVTIYGYDVLGRLTSVVEDLDPQSSSDTPLSTAYEYDLTGNLDRTDLPGGIVTDYVYDSLGRLDVQTDYAPDATPNDLRDNAKRAEYDYTVRADGKRTNLEETFWLDGDNDPQTPATPHATSYDWTYDSVGRLTDEAIDHFDNNIDQTEHFVYDLVGNRLSLTKDVGNDSTIDSATSYTYDINDRLITEGLDADNNGVVDESTTYGWAVTQQGSKTVVDGSSVTKSDAQFTYDLQGRMAQVTTTTFAGGIANHRERVTYGYVATGIRIESLQEIDDTADGVYETSVRTQFLVDSQNFTGYQQTLKESFTNGVTGQLQKTTEYTFGHDEIAQTLTTFDSSGAVVSTTTHVFGHDGHGSVRALFNSATSSTANLYYYDAFGQLIAIHNAAAQFVSNDSTAALTSLLYNGERFDSVARRIYLRDRFYDQSSGRFDRADSFSGNKSNPKSFHKYNYVEGDPVDLNDPSGNLGVLGLIGGFFGSLSVRVQDAAARSLPVLSIITFQIQFWSHRILTIAPQVEYRFTQIQVSLLFLEGATDAWLMNQDPIPDDRLARGKALEGITPANLGGNVKAIDDLRNGHATSVKTHALQSADALLTAISADLKPLDKIETQELSGTNNKGVFVRIPAGTIQTKSLLVGIPSNQAGFLSPAFRAQLTQLAQNSRVLIRIVPISGWRR